MENQTQNSKSKLLNIWLVTQLEKEDLKQLKSFFKSPSQVKISNSIPATKVSTKWANTSLDRNLREFIKHNDLPNSRNPLNDHSIFEETPVLYEGWFMPTKNFKVNPRRSRYDDNLVHFGKFHRILDAVGFDKESPICLDRHGRILDGVYRMWIMADINEKQWGSKIYIRVYDFE